VDVDVEVEVEVGNVLSIVEVEVELYHRALEVVVEVPLEGP
jgi:hypothetical protein